METFAVLSDPSRRKIVELLARGERSVGEIHKEFQMSGPAVSQHLKVLKNAGMVHVTVAAQRRIYGLNREPLDEMMRWIVEIKSFWDTKLDSLERELRKGDEA